MMKRRVALTIAGMALAPAIAFAQAPGANTLVLAGGTDASTLDPDDITSRDTANIAQHIWASLFQITQRQDRALSRQSYTESDDGKKLTFKLNAGLTCHDGEPLTAEDVVYSFKRAADPAVKFTGNTPGFVFASLGYKDARVVDDLTAEITIAKYNPIALGMVSEVYVHARIPIEKMTRSGRAEARSARAPTSSSNG